MTLRIEDYAVIGDLSGSGRRAGAHRAPPPHMAAQPSRPSRAGQDGLAPPLRALLPHVAHPEPGAPRPGDESGAGAERTRRG